MRKTMDPTTLFSINEHLADFEDDLLESLDELVDWEGFGEFITERLGYGDNPQGGRPPFKPVIMFKLLILQSMSNCSDAKAEKMARYYIPWMLFLGFNFGDVTPDENTIRHFRNRLTETEAMPILQESFEEQLRAHGFFPKAGQIIDGSLVKAPRQRLTKEEREAVKEGKTAQEIWPDEPNTAAQKDVDARWVSRSKGKPGSGGSSGPLVVERDFGYKICCNVDLEYKLIWNHAVGPASMHDINFLKDLVIYDNESPDVYGDSAYPSKENKRWLKERGLRGKFIEKKPRGKPMPAATARANSKNSKKRARVEHVFGHIKNRYGLYIRTIGLDRAETKLSLAALAYNMDRLIFLKRRRCSVG